MIYVHDAGRLCNNLLQYGHLYAWGREHNRSTVSMRFAYKYPWFHICHTPRHNFLTYVFAKYAAKWGLIPTITFHDPNADTSPQEQAMLQHHNVVVTGWYARWYDLFLKYQGEIKELFAFDSKIKSTVKSQLEEMESGENAPLRLGLHIRRGDYKTWSNGRYYYSDEQYLQVIRQFIALHSNRSIHIYICGNDPTLAHEQYQQALPQCKISFPCGNPAEDLCLLSECDYLIGPPSTFSLVAAFYHDRPLYWIEDPSQPLEEESFGHFADLFRNIR